MNTKLPLLMCCLLISLSAFSQRKHDQYSFEAGYGLGMSGKPGITQFSHYEVGFRYMLNEYWGLKFDFGSDKFDVDVPEDSNIDEYGTDYKRISVQAVYNLGRYLNINESVENFNVLAHGGLGYSYINPINNIVGDQTDSIGNVIVGVTPQLYIIRNVALHADLSYIINLSQHRDFDGTFHNRNNPIKGFVGGLANASLGLTFYIGPNGSDSDWR